MSNTQLFFSLAGLGVALVTPASAVVLTGWRKHVSKLDTLDRYVLKASARQDTTLEDHERRIGVLELHDYR
jgi:hypothetical protein